MLDKVFSRKAAEFGTSLLVLVSAGLSGHQAALGMTQQQLIGAATAILGSVMAAVMAPVMTSVPTLVASGRRSTSGLWPPRVALC